MIGTNKKGICLFYLPIFSISISFISYLPLFLKYSFTAGATSVPYSSMDFSTSSWGIEPIGKWSINLSSPSSSIIFIIFFATSSGFSVHKLINSDLFVFSYYITYSSLIHSYKWQLHEVYPQNDLIQKKYTSF